MICKKCGSELNAGADFCPKCGASMKGNQLAGLDFTTKTKVKKATISVFALSLIGDALATFIIMAYENDANTGNAAIKIIASIFLFQALLCVVFTIAIFTKSSIVCLVGAGIGIIGNISQLIWMFGSFGMPVASDISLILSFVAWIAFYALLIVNLFTGKIPIVFLITIGVIAGITEIMLLEGGGAVVIPFVALFVIACVLLVLLIFGKEKQSK